MNINSCSDKSIDPVHYWFPPKTERTPQSNRSIKSSLKIAVVVGDRLYQGLRYEAELYILTSETWEQILSLIDIDFLLVEPCEQIIRNGWQLGDSGHFMNQALLVQIVNAFRKRSVPVVLWNTQDHSCHDHFAEFSRYFDIVFCADPKECDLLDSEGVIAQPLLPAGQAVMHGFNYKRSPSKLFEFEIPVLYDGMADIYKLEKQTGFLKYLKTYGIKLIESQDQTFTVKKQDSQLIRKSFLGVVTRFERVATLMHTKTVVTVSNTSRSKTQQQWLALEACGYCIPVLYMGKLEVTDIRHGLVSSFETFDDLLLALECYRQDDLYRMELAYSVCEKVNKEHTYSHRVSRICESLAIDAVKLEYCPEETY